MPVIQKTNGFSSNELLQAAAQLNPAEPEKFVAAAIALRAKRQVGSLSQQESELLLKINNHIAAKTQKRFDELVAKRESETIEPQEYRELLRLTDKIEKADAKRLELLTELAKVRQQTFDEAAREFGIGLTNGA